jgi:hypothetical protein
MDMHLPLFEIAFFGHWVTQSPQARHLFRLYINSGFGLCPSGLWHHQQRKGQPLKNIVVRMPGPSSVAYFLTSKTKPFWMVLFHLIQNAAIET